MVPATYPYAVNRPQGETFWETLGKAGTRVRVMRVPVTFPPEPFPHGELLAGLGTPDLSGRIGKPFYFTSELFPARAAATVVEVVELVDNRGPSGRDQAAQRAVPGGGPTSRSPWSPSPRIVRNAFRFEAHLGRRVERLGAFTFPFNSLIKLRASAVQAAGILEVRLYRRSRTIRACRRLHVTTPPSSSAIELARSVQDQRLDDRHLVMKAGDEQTFLGTSMTVDNLEILDACSPRTGTSGALLRVPRPGAAHDVPLLRPQASALHRRGRRSGRSILQSYQEMDRIVGGVMTKRPDAALMVVSDHGFASFRRGMNYNTWLAKNGYMASR
jgi:hypothetical protein